VDLDPQLVIKRIIKIMKYAKSHAQISK
jgi:hypothetical protein